jgi:hypothetical protein
MWVILHTLQYVHVQICIYLYAREGRRGLLSTALGGGVLAFCEERGFTWFVVEVEKRGGRDGRRRRRRSSRREELACMMNGEMDE